MNSYRIKFDRYENFDARYRKICKVLIEQQVRKEYTIILTKQGLPDLIDGNASDLVFADCAIIQW